MKFSVNRYIYLVLFAEILFCGSTQGIPESAYIRREYRYSTSCLMTNYSALQAQDYVLPIFQGTKGVLGVERVREFAEKYGEILCYDLPVGAGASSKRIREILNFYNERLFGKIDLDHPKYIRLYGDNFGWFIVYEFTNRLGGKGHVRLNLPSPFENLLTEKDKRPRNFAELRFNESEIISAYKGSKIRGPYGRRDVFLNSDTASLSALRGTAGFMQIVIDYYQPSSWSCPEQENYDNCVWRNP